GGAVSPQRDRLSGEIAGVASIPHRAARRDSINQGGCQMTEFRPKGGVTPYLNVDGARKALDFYKTAFAGIEREAIKADNSDKLMHSQIDINGSPVFVCDYFPEYGYSPVVAQGFNIHIHVDDA